MSFIVAVSFDPERKQYALIGTPQGRAFTTRRAADRLAVRWRVRYPEAAVLTREITPSNKQQGG